MTLSQLSTLLRREVIGDKSADVWTNTEVESMLANAEVEIAAILGFPQATNTTSLSNGATSITVPSDLLNVQIQQVSIGDYDLNPGRMIEVLQRRNAGGMPEVYAYDPRRVGVIEFGPALPEAMASFVEYTQALTPMSASGDDAWGDLFPQFHWLIPLRAGVNAWRSVQDFERASYFQQEFQVGLASFASFLGVPMPQQYVQSIEQNRADHAGVS